MKSIIIADSSAIVSMFSPHDANNTLAIEASRKIAYENQAVCIPSDVFSETLSIIGKKISHKVAITIGEQLIMDKRFLIINITEDIRQKGFEIFKKQPESVSFTDCIVMATADQFETKEIFGFDEIFHKNGYIRVGFDKT